VISNPRDNHGFGQLKDCQYLRPCQKWNPFVNVSPERWLTQCTRYLPSQTGLKKKLEGLPGDIEMVHAVFRTPSIPDRVKKTRGIDRRPIDGLRSGQDTYRARQGLKKTRGIA
jgi:hypothetical protein